MKHPFLSLVLLTIMAIVSATSMWMSPQNSEVSTILDQFSKMNSSAIEGREPVAQAGNPPSSELVKLKTEAALEASEKASKTPKLGLLPAARHETKAPILTDYQQSGWMYDVAQMVSE